MFSLLGFSRPARLPPGLPSAVPPACLQIMVGPKLSCLFELLGCCSTPSKTWLVLTLQHCPARLPADNGLTRPGAFLFELLGRCGITSETWLVLSGCLERGTEVLTDEAVDAGRRWVLCLLCLLRLLGAVYDGCHERGPEALRER